MRLGILSGLIVSLMLPLRAGDPPPQEVPTWRVGILKGTHVAIGAETTGWTVDGLDIEPGKVDLKSHDGIRVAVFGLLGVRTWKERGEQPVLRAQRIVRVRRGESDLVVQGKVVLLAGQKLERARVGVWVYLFKGVNASFGEFASAVPAADGAYELRIPAMANEFAGWRYRLFVHVDEDGDGKIGEFEMSPRIFNDDMLEPDTLYFMNDEWKFGGVSPVAVQSPCTRDLRFER